MSITVQGYAPDVLTPANQRYLPNMWAYLPYIADQCYVNFASYKTQPGSQGNPPSQQLPQGASYPDSNNQALFFVEMQDMGGTGFIPFLATQWGLWVERDIQTYGALMTTSDPYKSVSPGAGGGAILIGHGLYQTTTPPLISLTDSDIWVDQNNHALGKFDTLHLFMADGSTPAHLDVGNLTVRGVINLNDDNVRLYRDTNSIRVQTPSAGGLIVEQNLWCNALVVNTIGISSNIFGQSGSFGDRPDRGLTFGDSHGDLTSWVHPWGAYPWFSWRDGISTAELMRLDMSGNLSLAGSLYLTGNSNGYLWNNGGYIRVSGGNGFVSDSSITSGNLAYSGTVAVYTNNNGTLIKNPSSIRYKQDVKTLEDCSWVYNLRPVNFDWKDEERKQIEGRQMGLIAEEVYIQNPQLTWHNKEGEPEGVHYDRLVVPLIVEVKKLHQRVETLENQLKNKAAA